jgi:putative transposase
VNRPNQVWVADTLELLIGGRKAFLALIEDMYTRRVMGLALSFSNNALLTREALDMGLLKGTPQIHHSDQGTTYAADLYTKPLIHLKVTISMAAAGKAWENGYAERLNRTFRREEIVRTEYANIRDARAALGAYAKLYNELRIHMSLGYQTPKEVNDAYAKDNETGK